MKWWCDAALKAMTPPNRQGNPLIPQWPHFNIPEPNTLSLRLERDVTERQFRRCACGKERLGGNDRAAGIELRFLITLRIGIPISGLSRFLPLKSFIHGRSAAQIEEQQHAHLHASSPRSSRAARLPESTPPFMKPGNSPLVCSPAKTMRPSSSGAAAASYTQVYCPTRGLE